MIKSHYINSQCVSVQHEDNFLLLDLLLPEYFFQGDNFVSCVKNKPQLTISMINKYKYTLEMCFQYSFDFGHSEEIIIKSYQDAKVAEIVYCTDVQKFIRLLGPKVCPKIHKQTRGILNAFLNKWLNFLLQNGYCRSQWIKCSEN